MRAGPSSSGTSSTISRSREACATTRRRRTSDFTRHSDDPGRSGDLRRRVDAERDLADADRPDHPDLSPRREQPGLSPLHARLQGGALQRAGIGRNLQRASPADEEYNDAWEAGLRGRWFERPTLRVDLLLLLPLRELPGVPVPRPSRLSPPVLEIRNAEEAENYGIEVEGSVAPLRGWAPRLLEGLICLGQLRLAPRRVSRFPDHLDEVESGQLSSRSSSISRASSSRTRPSTRSARPPSGPSTWAASGT